MNVVPGEKLWYRNDTRAVPEGVENTRLGVSSGGRQRECEAVDFTTKAPSSFK